MPEEYVVTLACANRPGIVAAVSQFLYDHGCDIRNSHQFDDQDRFFIRVVFRRLASSPPADSLARWFSPIAEKFDMEWTLRPVLHRKRVLIMVSRFDHCLADLIYRWRIGELPMDLSGIVSNYPSETYAHLDIADVPFHHLPVNRDNKPAQEAELMRIVETTNTDLVVLARYMQVLSDDLTRKLAGRCINIHHSFLPGFKGAKPYHQAFERGVKLIGATAHFVTAELDEGPIIEQDVERITHADTPEDLVRKGRDIERRVLARAVRYHLADRVLVNGHKTVVFPD
ncbi:formyltetrahydrofolate deformylase [Lichenihabitans sp. PAMC28606]|uniref:formyltetrahydrofolate deformylase n=1 Tax=Lichenihabitans sp. PAMC28606 TaxID=2880932 RepID=UPI001D0ACF55|nr:formyltetrahydrofolate deformylase [Lichenihabitans sp. PAMC28606]UDL95781.1 formyltetrahydrofolate deformylase [Lichenihabitans sp. PAMC28606]